jgi:hypothetical protein
LHKNLTPLLKMLLVSENVPFSVGIILPSGVFGNRLDWKKWASTVADLIDVRKKVRMFCIEK